MQVFQVRQMLSSEKPASVLNLSSGSHNLLDFGH